MHVKVVNPKTDGKKAYANRDSAQRTVNYVSQEAKSNKGEPEFFGAESDVVLTAQQVVAMLDENHRGLRREEAKFYSIVLSPSVRDACDLRNDASSLAAYTRKVMDIYADNFSFKDGRKATGEDLVWAAIIHRDRQYKGLGEDAERQGLQKPGLQTHVHVLVSARDKAQNTTLNPLGRPQQFERVQFYARACEQLEVQVGRLGPDIGVPAPSRAERVAQIAEEIRDAAAAAKQRLDLKPAQLAAKEARLEQQLNRVNGKLLARQQLDPVAVKEAARTRGHDAIFYDRLREIERKAERGRYTPQPIQYLTSGRLSPATTFAIPEKMLSTIVAKSGLLAPATPTPLPAPYSFEQAIHRLVTHRADSPSQAPETSPPTAVCRALEQSMQRIAQALTPPAPRPQPAREEEQQTQKAPADYEYGL